MTPKNYRQMREALEEIRDKASTMKNGGAWAGGLAMLCLGTLDPEWTVTEGVGGGWAPKLKSGARPGTAGPITSEIPPVTR